MLAYQHDSMWQATKVILEHRKTIGKKKPHVKLAITSQISVQFCGI